MVQSKKCQSKPLAAVAATWQGHMWHQCLHFWSETFDVAQERTGVSYNVHLPGFQIWHIAILLSHLISRLEAIAIRLQAILLSHLIGVLFLQGSRVPCDSQIQGDGCWNQSPRIVGNTLLFWIQWHRSARICSLLESLISTTQFCLGVVSFVLLHHMLASITTNKGEPMQHGPWPNHEIAMAII